MTSSKELNIKFSRKDFKDAEKWCERMIMAAMIREYIEEKLFATRLNLEGCARKWFKNVEN